MNGPTTSTKESKSRNGDRSIINDDPSMTVAMTENGSGGDGSSRSSSITNGNEGSHGKKINNNDAYTDEEHQILVPLMDTNSRRSSMGFTPSQQLVVDKKVYKWSLLAMRLAVLADAVNNTILRPNYPFMVDGVHEDSFPSTAPFNFASAQYFIPMTSILATAIAATFVGSLSDKVGRRPVMLVCVGFGVIGSVAKYLASGSFWGFCAANFVTGLFGATLAISIAYASDVVTTRAEKDGVIGSLVGINMLGATGGGIVTIAMGRTGLFTPLLVGAGLNLLATIFAYFYLIEPKKLLHMGVIPSSNDDDDDEEDGKHSPDHLNWKVTTNIIVGSVLDNAGSTGLIPFCLSPLMFQTFLGNFVNQGLQPIMSDDAFRWLSTFLAVMIIPAAGSSARLFEKIGAPASCVGGNFLTGVVTIALLQVALIDPPTNATFGIFVVIMYLGFPLTVFSQLSTGPMLDRISPAESRGFTQGLNTTAMNFGQAMFPWLFGLMADAIGTETTIWTCVGISFVAAIANSPLMCVDELKPKKIIPDSQRAIKYEDKDLIEKALRGEWVPPDQLRDINMRRLRSNHHFLAIPFGSYEQDSKDICKIQKHAKEDMKFYYEFTSKVLGSPDFESAEKREIFAGLVNRARIDHEERMKVKDEVGQWFGDYLVDAGYHIDDSPMIMKQIIMTAFPRLTKPGETETTGENIEQVTINQARLYKHYMEENSNPAWIRAFAGAGFYGQ